MFCQECGQQNADDAKFCVKCGKNFVNLTKGSSDVQEAVRPVSPTTRNSVQSPSFVDSSTPAGKELKDSGVVTVMSVIGFVFGLIGMLGSFIPCLGSFALFIGIPAALVSAIGLFIAYSQRAKKTFAIVAVTISLIGVVISGVQYFAFFSSSTSVIQALDDYRHKQSVPTPAPAAPEAPQPPAAPEVPAVPEAPAAPDASAGKSSL